MHGRHDRIVWAAIALLHLIVSVGTAQEAPPAPAGYSLSQLVGLALQNTQLLPAKRARID